MVSSIAETNRTNIQGPGPLQDLPQGQSISEYVEACPLEAGEELMPIGKIITAAIRPIVCPHCGLYTDNPPAALSVLIAGVSGKMGQLKTFTVADICNSLETSQRATQQIVAELTRLRLFKTHKSPGNKPKIYFVTNYGSQLVTLWRGVGWKFGNPIINKTWARSNYRLIQKRCRERTK